MPSRWIAIVFACMCSVAAGQGVPVIAGDAMNEPLTDRPGDAARGREVVLDRSQGACVLCHAVPDEKQRFMGNVAPSLSGVAKRLSAGQMRLRIVDGTRIDPAMAMPGYYRVDGLNDVAASYRGKPVLTAQQVEDVIAYLLTLK